MAQKAATLQILADGRFTLGLGSGENLNEHVVGAGWPPADVRQEMLVEALHIIRELFDGEGYTNYRGEHFDVESAKLWDLPEKRVPIGVAVSGEQSCRIAGELGDAMIGVEPQAELGEWFDAAGGTGKPRIGQMPICFDRDQGAAVTRAHSLFRWFGLGWKVNAELPGPRPSTPRARSCGRTTSPGASPAATTSTPSSRPRRPTPTPGSPIWRSSRSVATSRLPFSSGPRQPDAGLAGRFRGLIGGQADHVGVRSPANTSSRALRAVKINGMTEDFDARLRRLRASVDTDALIDLGCDLAAMDRQLDAEWCFRRAADLGDGLGSFNLAIALRAQGRGTEAVAAYEAAVDGGVTDAWRDLGNLLEELGDLAGAMHAYRGAAGSVT